MEHSMQVISMTKGKIRQDSNLGSPQHLQKNALKRAFFLIGGEAEPTSLRCVHYAYSLRSPAHTRVPFACSRTLSPEFKSQLSATLTKKRPKRAFFFNWRRGRDSNSGWGRPHDGFQDRCIKPLCHLSIYVSLSK